MALDLASGKVIGSLHARHRAIESSASWQRSMPRPEHLDVHPDLGLMAEPGQALVR
jgi:hypothetical protein